MSIESVTSSAHDWPLPHLQRIVNSITRPNKELKEKDPDGYAEYRALVDQKQTNAVCVMGNGFRGCQLGNGYAVFPHKALLRHLRARSSRDKFLVRLVDEFG